ncbi:MAG TPA: hypothetical protein O0Y06_08015 [Methanocorpusculum sp.]|nr:hypothetical protein [Methanocorpusculum sp.]HJK80830.1 hypothetical protein [Methanocorpusculum sp.]
MVIIPADDLNLADFAGSITNETATRTESGDEESIPPEHPQPIQLKTGHRITCESIGERVYSTGTTMIVYRWILTAGENPPFEFETNSKGTVDIWKGIESHITKTETRTRADYIRCQLNPSGGEIPPWERKEPTRKYHRDPEEAYFSLNDDGNATRFYQEADGYLVFEQNQRIWYAWIENHWELAKERVGKVARFIGLSLRDELKYWEKILRTVAEDDPLRKSISLTVSSFKEFVSQGRNDIRQAGMLRMVAGSVMNADFEKQSNPDILTFQNGAINCKTGTHYPIEECDQLKDQYPTIYVDAWYTPGARSQAFVDHLATVFMDNTTSDLPEDQAWEQMHDIGRLFLRLLGYSLYPGNPEQIFLFLWGSGSNGKSTTIDVLREIFGDQMAEPSIKELYTSGEDRPASGICGGLGKRLLLFSEASDDENDRKGGRVSRDTVKELTGDRYTSRFRHMYAPAKRQRVLAFPIGVTNELPRFDKEIDDALLRRLITIPFPHKFEDSEKDKTIVDRLHQDRDLIFSMIIDELMKYLAEGLPPIPEVCTRIQSELLSGSDLAMFVTSQLVKTDGKTKEDRMSRSEIQDLYIDWCDSLGIDIGTKMALAAGLDQYGCQQKKRVLTDGEAKKLYKALRVSEITDKRNRVERYFCCRRQ